MSMMLPILRICLVVYVVYSAQADIPKNKSNCVIYQATVMSIIPVKSSNEIVLSTASLVVVAAVVVVVAKMNEIIKLCIDDSPHLHIIDYTVQT